MSNVWLTSDTHIGHKNIIELAGRPFDSVEQMNQEIIARWRRLVAPTDIVYHLGDLALCRKSAIYDLLDQLTGYIHLVTGNHDGSIKGSIVRRFQWVKHYHEFRHDGRKIVLFHYPLASWNQAHRGAVHFHGHCHGNLKDVGLPRLDVGVDCHGYSPILIGDALDLIDGRVFSGVDHHEQTPDSET